MYLNIYVTDLMLNELLFTFVKLKNLRNEMIIKAFTHREQYEDAKNSEAKYTHQ